MTTTTTTTTSTIFTTLASTTCAFVNNSTCGDDSLLVSPTTEPHRAIAPAGAADANIPYQWDIMGAMDILLPGLILCHLIGQVYRYLERRYITSTPGKVTYLSFVGFVARFSLMFMPLLPYRLLRTRWDWIIVTPTIYEIVAHLYHFNDTGKNFKKFYFAHHLAAVCVLWPSYRFFETTPYPVSALSFALAFEVASGFSYLHYVMERITAPIMTNLHLTNICTPKEVLDAFTYLSFTGQRLMRWYSLLSGVHLGLTDFQNYPYLIPCLVVPSMMFEAKGFHVQYTHLPPFPAHIFTRKNMNKLTKAASSY